MDTIVADPLRYQDGGECHSRRSKEYEEYTREDDTPRQHASIVMTPAGGHEGKASAHIEDVLNVS